MNNTEEEVERLLTLAARSKTTIDYDDIVKVAQVRATMAVQKELSSIAENLRIANLLELSKFTPNLAELLDKQTPRILRELKVLPEEDPTTPKEEND